MEYFETLEVDDVFRRLRFEISDTELKWVRRGVLVDIGSKVRSSSIQKFLKIQSLK